mgnify:CR=1 FL=1|tara:strand:- start:3304 stop:3924 length:621 start_codon:yes stop_codon:yes gene_type:complete
MFKNILWDFDGVILDSMPTRDHGFREIFKLYPSHLVDELIVYHKNNGGLSRFNKIHYFFRNILKKKISEREVRRYANKFSIIMKEQLANPEYLIEESMNFIKLNYKYYNFHIVSGSEHNELNFLCNKLRIKKYFYSISGSPTPKVELIKNLMDEEAYGNKETLLIGDSLNDYEAAKTNEIKFYGFNNLSLKNMSDEYILDFDGFTF